MVNRRKYVDSLTSIRFIINIIVTNHLICKLLIGSRSETTIFEREPINI